jgi:hypothetical protein
MIGSPFYYLGIVLVVVGSWVWVALMIINLNAWKKNNAGKPVPLAMFGNVAGAYLWAWTSVGAAVEILFLILPVALGFKDTIDAGLARVFFSWTLHAIVYFWLCRATSRSTRSSRAPSAAGSTATRWDASRSSCSWCSRCRSASTICSPIRSSVPDSSSSTPCSRRWCRFPPS